MSLSTLAIVCSVVGGASELAGIIIVARGIGQDRQRARDLFKPKRVRQQVERDYPPRVSEYGLSGGALGPYESEATKRKRTEGNLAALANALIGMRKAVDTERDALADQLVHEIDQNDRQIREGLVYVLAGSIGDRKVGALLLAGGVALSVAGSVLSSLN